MRGPLAGIDRFPRVSLGHTPTPLDPTPGLGALLGIELWIKRDDCTGLAAGGNKVRQLSSTLSRHRRAAPTPCSSPGRCSRTSPASRLQARESSGWTSTFNSDRVEDADDLYRSTGNVLLDRLLGATVHSFPLGEDETAADDPLDHLAQSLADSGRKP